MGRVKARTLSITMLVLLDLRARKRSAKVYKRSKM
jgi:hypothetical protein